jgi:hypothetical protein
MASLRQWNAWDFPGESVALFKRFDMGMSRENGQLVITIPEIDFAALTRVSGRSQH